MPWWRVYVVEGEKDVHAIERAGGVATCNPGGAGKWRDDYNTLLHQAADVVVVQDRDDPGRAHAATVAAATGATVLEPKTGKDAYDHLAAGHGLADFVPIGVEEDAHQHRNGNDPRAWLFGRPMDPCAVPADPLPLLPGIPFMHPGMAAVVAGPTGKGRSSLIQACIYDAARAGLLIAYLGSEITADEFDARAALLAGKRGDDPEEIRDELARGRYLDLADTLAIAWRNPEKWTKDVAGLYNAVVVDPLGDALEALPLDDRNNDYRRFYTRLIQPLVDRGVAVVMLDNVGHAEDAQERPIGPSAKGHKADLTFVCSVQAEPLGLRIRCKKKRSERCAFKEGDLWIFEEATRTFSDPLTGKFAQPPETPRAPVREELERKILASLPAVTKTTVAEALGRTLNDRTFGDAWSKLQQEGRIARKGGQWVVVVVATPLGDDYDYDPDGDTAQTRA